MAKFSQHPGQYSHVAMHFSLILLILFFLAPAGRHDFHTSLAEVHYNQAAQTLEVSLRVFTDDLESALSKENGGKVIRVTEDKAADSFIQTYLSRYFSVTDGANRRNGSRSS